MMIRKKKKEEREERKEGERKSDRGRKVAN